MKKSNATNWVIFKHCDLTICISGQSGNNELSSNSEVPFLSLDYYDYFGSQTTEDFSPSPTTTSSETDVATVLETTKPVSTFLELQEEEKDRKTVDGFVVSSSSSSITTDASIPSNRVIFPSDPILKARRQETTSWPPAVKSTERNWYDLVVQPVVLPSWLRALEQKYERKRKGKNDAGVEEICVYKK